MTTNAAPHTLTDRALLVETEHAAANARVATGRLVALLSELDARRLYLGQGCASLFTYSTQMLRLSEHAAYGRIEAARGTVSCGVAATTATKRPYASDQSCLVTKSGDRRLVGELGPGRVGAVSETRISSGYQIA